MLRDNLYREEDVLILDCRSHEDYRIGHISGSHNIVLPQLMMRRLKANKLSLKNLVPQGYMQGKDTFLRKCKSYSVVLYDHFDHFNPEASDSSMMRLLYNRFCNEGCSVSVLKGMCLMNNCCFFTFQICDENNITFHTPWNN